MTTDSTDARADRGEPPTFDLRAAADAMITFPKICPPTTTVAEASIALLDDHVHALLVVDDRRLLAVVERSDLPLAPADTPLRQVGRLADRTIRSDADLHSTWQWMRARRIRGLAVVDRNGDLLGLLCLKRSGTGFCTDAGVLARHVNNMASEGRNTG